MAVCGISVGIANNFTKPLYIGRTTVMERQQGPEQGVPVYREYVPMTNLEVHLSNLGNIATSQEVMRRSAESLLTLGITVDPRSLLRTVSVRPVQNTQILAIEVTSPDVIEAKAAADVIAYEFKRFYTEVIHGATSLSREFIQGQVIETQRQLEQAQEAKRRFMEEQGVVNLGAQSQIVLQRIHALDNEITSATVHYNEAAARMDIYDVRVRSEPEYRLSGHVEAMNPIWLQLKQDLVKLEAALGTQLTRRGRGHPDVQFLEKQIAEVSSDLKAEEERIVQSESTQVNPVHAAAVSSYLAASAEKDAAQARLIPLQAAKAELVPQLGNVPEREMRMAQLELEQRATEQTYQLLRTKLDEARIKEQESQKQVGIKVIDAAYVYPVDQKHRMKLFLALMFSPMLGAALAFILNYMDNTIKTPAEAEDLLGLPVFSAVPLARAHSLVRRPDAAAIQAAYQMLSTNLWTTVAESESPTLLVASAEPDAGRSVTAANLAVTLARDGAKVIIVDADMRKPTQHLMFSVDNKRGLSNILSGTADIEDAVVPTKVEGLLLIPAGPAPDNPVRLLRSPEMRELIDQLSTLADFVIFDSPAGVTFADPVLLAAYVKNVVLVHAAGRVPRGSEAEFRSRLEQVDVNLIGVVLNRVRPEDSHGYFHYKKSYQDVVSSMGKRQLMASSSSVRAIPDKTGKKGDDDLS
jgi:polysaccharide biosynthesis transport protein